jgi:hypothetical protein
MTSAAVSAPTATPRLPPLVPPPGREHRREEARDQEQQRPDEVELLLDRQGPEVLHGGSRVVGLQVVDRVRRELPVLDVQRARQDLLRRVGELGRGLDDPRRDPRHGQDKHRGRDQPPGTPSPEVGQADLSRARVAAPQVAGDQVPGDDEEHVHPGEASRQRRGVQVVDHHHRDGDGPQSLDVRPESPALRRFPGGTVNLVGLSECGHIGPAVTGAGPAIIRLSSMCTYQRVPHEREGCHQYAAIVRIWQRRGGP